MTLHGTSVRRGFALSIGIAFVASGVINGVICLAAVALGANTSVVLGLNPPFFLSFALIGLLAAAAAWSLVRSRARRPAAVMQVLVPVVVLVSLVPDLLVGLAGLGWTGAFALMLMHLSVAVCGVTALRRFLPLTLRATVVA